MLNKRELTLGHTYSIDPWGKNEWITRELQATDYNNYIAYPERYNGIPLTPEILTENLGLTYDGDDYDFPIDDYPFWICLTGDQWYLCTDHYGGAKYQRKIDYVHQVQNIAYDLSGEELKFKTKDK